MLATAAGLSVHSGESVRFCVASLLRLLLQHQQPQQAAALVHQGPLRHLHAVVQPSCTRSAAQAQLSQASSLAVLQQQQRNCWPGISISSGLGCALGLAATSWGHPFSRGLFTSPASPAADDSAPNAPPRRRRRSATESNAALRRTTVSVPVEPSAVNPAHPDSECWLTTTQSAVLHHWSQHHVCCTATPLFFVVLLLLCGSTTSLGQGRSCPQPNQACRAVTVHSKLMVQESRWHPGGSGLGNLGGYAMHRPAPYI